MTRARGLGEAAGSRFREFAEQYDFVRSAKGAGLFLGLDFAIDGAPAPELAKQVVESMKRRNVLISRIGRDESVLKVRPPLAFSSDELPILLDALDESIAEV